MAVDFLLTEALRNVATKKHHFVLRTPERPDFQVVVDFDPLGEIQQNNFRLHRYRKTIQTINKANVRPSLSSVACVDLQLGCFVALEMQGVQSTLRNANNLPTAATVGQSSDFFEHLTPLVNKMAWSLEEDSLDTALWCINVLSANGKDVENSECFLIKTNGEVLGFMIRTWAQKPNASSKQLIELKSF
jgi:hypothetical protein